MERRLVAAGREQVLASAKAKKIQELREARGLSVDELSHRMGVDAATVRRWEAVDADMDEGSLAQLASTLGVSQDELRHEEDARHHG
jgi:ribosome-binding protein aMBF1 (putative translation factor)